MALANRRPKRNDAGDWRRTATAIGQPDGCLRPAIELRVWAAVRIASIQPVWHAATARCGTKRKRLWATAATAASGIDPVWWHAVHPKCRTRKLRRCEWRRLER